MEWSCNFDIFKENVLLLWALIYKVAFCLVAMPSTRSRSQSSIQFPKTKTAKTGVKADLRIQAKSEAGAVPPLSVCKEQPLSPRKRLGKNHACLYWIVCFPFFFFVRYSPSCLSLGDDNLCNIPQSLRCSPPKQSRNENGPISPAKGRRLIFDENQAAATPLSPSKKTQDTTFSSPQKRGQETPSSNPHRGPQERKSVCTRLFKQEGETTRMSIPDSETTLNHSFQLCFCIDIFCSVSNFNSPFLYFFVN